MTESPFTPSFVLLLVGLGLASLIGLGVGISLLQKRRFELVGFLFVYLAALNLTLVGQILWPLLFQN